MGKIIFTIPLLFVSLGAKSQEEKPFVMKGNELYKKQQYEKAAEEYRKATDINGKNSKASYNLGNALYKSKKPEAAQKAYDDAAENAKDAAEKSRAVYNKGVSLSREKKLAESIDAYKQTLRLNPKDEEARQNLQKALNDLKKQPPQQQPKQDKKKQDKKQKQNDQQQNKSKLNQKQVEQMLNALRQDEKKLQQDIQKKNNIIPPNGKDW